MIIPKKLIEQLQAAILKAQPPVSEVHPETIGPWPVVIDADFADALLNTLLCVNRSAKSAVEDCAKVVGASPNFNWYNYWMD